MFGSFLGALGVLMLFPLQGGAVLRGGWSMAITILPGIVMIFVVGMLDDMVELRPWQKLVGQFVASGLAIWGGVRLDGVFAHHLDPWLSIPATFVWLVGCTNAFNLIDGVDGLAAGTGAFATLTILIGALVTDNFGLALLAVPLLGSILGFLRYNFDPATIFLGDSGSLVIGFVLGCFGLLWSQKSATVLGITAPIMALALPLVDTTVSIGRRFIKHEPIFGGDRDHIHHRLLKSGLTPRRAVLLLYCVSAVGAVFSLLGTVVKSGQLQGLVVFAFCVTAWFGINRLGYHEFGVAGKMLLNGTFQKRIRGELELRRFSERLGTAEALEDYWCAVRDEARSLGFRSVELEFGTALFRERFDNVKGKGPGWTIETVVNGGGLIRLERPYSATPLLAPAEALAMTLNRGVSITSNRRPRESAPARREESELAQEAAGGSPV
ncbi:MAG: hypothetical protein GC160_24010 [Acidobacteria bacterium]|nr:hypothetical protein [Acidobacteriota bacterium]